MPTYGHAFSVFTMPTSVFTAFELPCWIFQIVKSKWEVFGFLFLMLAGDLARDFYKYGAGDGCGIGRFGCKRELSMQGFGPGRWGKRARYQNTQLPDGGYLGNVRAQDERQKRKRGTLVSGDLAVVVVPAPAGFWRGFSAPNFALQTTLRFKVGLCSNKKSANFLRSALRGWVPGTLSCGYMAFKFKFRFDSINPIN